MANGRRCQQLRKVNEIPLIQVGSYTVGRGSESLQSYHTSSFAVNEVEVQRGHVTWSALFADAAKYRVIGARATPDSMDQQH
jgi:hypothetical protein